MRTRINEFVKNNYNELLNLLNLIKVGIFITDGKGDVMMLNKESERTGEMDFGEVVGKNMEYLENIGYVDESSVIKAIEGKDDFTMVQLCKGDTSIYVTATPLIDENGDVDIVLCTERDITETNELKKLLKKTRSVSEQQKKEIEYLRKVAFASKGNIVAESSCMKNLLNFVNRIAASDATVMLSGESGVGKEVIANYIYENSNRVGKPFIKINCANIPDNLLEAELFGYESGAFTGASTEGKIGIFEQADGGTLFLDEVAEISAGVQAKLLRVLQEKEIRRVGGYKSIKIDTRIITATNVDLKDAVKEKKFREDLYYRLNVLPVKIPPLRERREDIRPLVEIFVAHFNERHGTSKSVDEDAMHLLEDAEWHGNVRELQNVLERLMVMYEGMKITTAQVRNAIYPDRNKHFEDGIQNNLTLKEIMQNYERDVINTVLNESETAAEAAKKLGINKSTMSRKLSKYNI